MSEYQLPMQTRLKVSLPGTDDEYWAEVRERHGETLMMRVSPELVEVSPEDEVILKFGLEKFYWNVRVRVLAHYEVWWFLAEPTPDRWARLQRREFVRIAFEEPVIAIPDLTDVSLGLAPLHLRMIDVSASGCAVVSETEIRHQRITFVLRLPEGQVFSVPAQQVWGEANPDGTFAYGFDFVHTVTTVRDELASWVALRIQKGLSAGQDITT